MEADKVLNEHGRLYFTEYVKHRKPGVIYGHVSERWIKKTRHKLEIRGLENYSKLPTSHIKELKW